MPRIRREPALLIVTLLLAAWIWSGSSDRYRPPALRPTLKAYEAPVEPPPVLAARLDAPRQARELFREPSETEPLPPRPLAPPPFAPLPVVLPPLDPGPHPAAYASLRVPGGVVEEFQFDAAPDAGTQPAAAPEAAPAAPAAGTPPEPVVGNGAAPQGQGQDPLQTWDLVVTVTERGGQRYYGRILNADKYALHDKRGPLQASVFLDWINVADGKLNKANMELKGEEVQHVLLARTLRNEVELRKRQVGDGAASLPALLELIDWIVANAGDNGWAYDEAAQLADRYIERSNGAMRGYRIKGYVLARRGDPAKEFDFYEELPAALRESSFAYTGRGRMHAMLGLRQEAEREFRAAVAADPVDPVARLALAEHLRRMQRAGEALEHVEAAARNKAVLDTGNGRYELARVTAAVHLALGRIDDAERALGLVPEGEEYASKRALLKGAVAYARGDLAAAAASFQNAVEFGMASVGIGVAQTLAKQWLAARATLQAAADRFPLVRHRALSALGFLYVRTGHYADAITALEQALAADPTDAYSHYLLGHARRLAGQPEAAADAIEAALRCSDDLAEGMAEAALARFELAERNPDEAARALYEATKFADRLVELDARRKQDVRYLELQGLAHLRATDWKGARRAFEAGAAKNSLYCEVGLGLVDYALGNAEEARGRFQELATRRLQLGDPIRAWCEATIHDIDDHASKVQIRDGFAREELGNQWAIQPNGTVAPRLADGRLRIEGRLQTTGRPVFARRSVDEGAWFLRSEVRVQVAAGKMPSGFAGMQLALAAAGAAARSGDLQIQFGWLGGRPQIEIRDGSLGPNPSDDERKRFEPVTLDVAIDPTTPQHLMLEVTLTDSRRLLLHASWNGRVVHSRELQRLTPQQRLPLHVELVVEGSQGNEVDVQFDDFLLRRRQSL